MNKTMVRRIALSGALVFGVVATAASGESSDSSAPKKSGGAAETVSKGLGSQDASADVKVTGIESQDAIGLGSVELTVTNNSSKRSDYLIDVAAQSADGKTQIDTGSGLVNGLEPGQTTKVTAQMTKAIPAGSKAVVTEVSRTAATEVESNGVSKGFGSKDAAADVKVTSVDPGSDYGLGSAEVTVTNSSSGRSDYVITVAAQSPDGKTQVDTGTALVEKLEPGQTTKATAQMTEAIPAGSNVVVQEVQRTASS